MCMCVTLSIPLCVYTSPTSLCCLCCCCCCVKGTNDDRDLLGFGTIKTRRHSLSFSLWRHDQEPATTPSHTKTDSHSHWRSPSRSRTHPHTRKTRNHKDRLYRYYGLPITCRFFRTKRVRRLSNRNVAVRFSFFSLPIP